MPTLRLPSESPSLADAVAQAVRDGVAAGELAPDTTYSVYQLAEVLGVSRSPVREGLLRLAEAGLVEIRRNRGFRVLPPRAEDIDEIFAIRLALEPPAARRAATHGTDEQHAQIRAALDAMAAASGPAASGPAAGPGASGSAAGSAASGQGAAGSGAPGSGAPGPAAGGPAVAGPGAFWAADRSLHDALLRTAGRPRTAGIVDRLRTTTALLGPPTTASGRTLAEIHAEHQPVVTAVLARSGAAAEAAMRAHLEATRTLLMAGR